MKVRHTLFRSQWTTKGFNRPVNVNITIRNLESCVLTTGGGASLSLQVSDLQQYPVNFGQIEEKMKENIS